MVAVNLIEKKQPGHNDATNGEATGCKNKHNFEYTVSANYRISAIKRRT